MQGQANIMEDSQLLNFKMLPIPWTFIGFDDGRLKYILTTLNRIHTMSFVSKNVF